MANTCSREILLANSHARRYFPFEEHEVIQKEILVLGEIARGEFHLAEICVRGGTGDLLVGQWENLRGRFWQNC